MGSRTRSTDTERGFTLAALLVIISVMLIFLGVAIQSATFQMRREKEEELIFRGQQYVRAIQLFQKRYGRLPMSLKELWEAKPRVIRKKWKDPITDSYDWGLVFLGQEGGMGGGVHVGGGKTPWGVGGEPTPTPTPTPQPVSRGEEGKPTLGPIVGVYSKSCKESIKVYNGRTRYCDWKFVLERKQLVRKAPVPQPMPQPQPQPQPGSQPK